MKPHLISFKLCPFVQRSVIVMREKEVDLEITYIDLGNPPEWFGRISPLGKVPVLEVGDNVLFESAVIMEYLDEVNPPSLHPSDPLRKAHNRAWIEFSSSLLFAQYRMLTAKEESDFSANLDELRNGLGRVEEQWVGPFFNGPDLALIDAAYAPLFMRLNLLEQRRTLNLLERYPKLLEWQQRLLEKPSVHQSVVKDFPELFEGIVEKAGGFASQYFR